MKRLIVGIVSACALAAQDAPKAAEKEEALAPLHSVIVVTATRGETELEKAPVSMSVVSRRDLEMRNPQTLDQALTQLEGLFVLRTKGPADTNTRIQTRGYNGASRTLVLLDGQPVNDAYTGEAPWTSLPLSEVEQVEVVRGPFSSLYGGNAMGGVVNIRTRQIDRREIELTGQRGIYDTTAYALRFSQRFFDRLGVSLGYQRLQTGGI